MYLLFASFDSDSAITQIPPYIIHTHRLCLVDLKLLRNIPCAQHSSEAGVIETATKPILEFSSTLLFVGVKDNRYLVGHIGDGLIGYFEGNNVKTLSYPENGDSPNKTFFITGDNAINYFRIYKADKDYYTDYYPIGSQERRRPRDWVASAQEGAGWPFPVGSTAMP